MLGILPWTLWKPYFRQMTEKVVVKDHILSFVVGLHLSVERGLD
jgi:hypothetical protein